MSLPPILLRTTPLAWSAPALAPALGLIGLAGAFPGLAGTARSAWTRVGLAVTGLLWLLLAEALLGNQVPETVALAASARELGAAASSAFGAGFGGSVWALVPRGDAEGFATAWLERYTRDFPARAAAASTIITEADRAAEPVVSRVSV